MNNFNFVIKLITIFAVCVFAVSTYATEGKNERRLSFEPLDVDQDGRLSFKEFPKRTYRFASSEEIFKRLDKNQDRFISKDEIPAGRPSGRRRLE